MQQSYQGNPNQQVAAYQGHPAMQTGVPGTLSGTIARLQSVCNKSTSVADLALDAMHALGGRRDATPPTGTATPTPVPNGHLEMMDQVIDEIFTRLDAAEHALETIRNHVS